jgi:Holliday junction resolvase
MGKNHDKGYRHEAATRDYLTEVGLPVVRPQHAGAARDVGDITGVHLDGRPFLIECKNTARLELGVWLSALTPKVAAVGAFGGAVVHKRRGVGDPSQQYVTLTLGDLAALLIHARKADQ